jgi:hypothetical protein
LQPSSFVRAGDRLCLYHIWDTGGVNCEITRALLHVYKHCLFEWREKQVSITKLMDIVIAKHQTQCHSSFGLDPSKKHSCVIDHHVIHFWVSFYMSIHAEFFVLFNFQWLENFHLRKGSHRSTLHVACQRKISIIKTQVMQCHKLKGKTMWGN